MTKQDRFDEDALDFVFESMAFRAALEEQDDAKLANALAMLMRCRYGTDEEVAAAEGAGKKATKRKR